jgi:hypothetical protein
MSLTQHIRRVSLKSWIDGSTLIQLQLSLLLCQQSTEYGCSHSLFLVLRTCFSPSQSLSCLQTITIPPLVLRTPLLPWKIWNASSVAVRYFNLP